MKPVVIENPVLNSPYLEPKRHFRSSADGISDEVVEARRLSSYVVPVPPPKKRGKVQPQLFELEAEERVESGFINRIRTEVSLWRQSGYPAVTSTTARLLDYWGRADRERKLFFCQREAVETAIYLAEAAAKFDKGWIETALRQANEQNNPKLLRMAFKMATGSGKTVVMGMLIAWQALNKQAEPQDRRFSDSFLIVAPGITIRDRLRVLMPNDPQSYYRKLDLLPSEDLVRLHRAQILITNYHAFQLKELGEVSKLGKQILRRGKDGASAFTETADQMALRVCREFGGRRNIVVLNDEAHHCYRRKADADDVKLTGEDRKEAERREEEARVWISGLEAIQDKFGIRGVYDLSATPFFLRGSGYPEGRLFPWVVSDFSLIDAIESGVVKVPRVPVSDDSMVGELPTYRALWSRIGPSLPKKGRGTEAVTGEPKLPVELQGALLSLYGNYQQAFLAWEASVEAQEIGLPPPVFIVVCQNTNISKLVYDFVAGYEKTLPDGTTIAVPGQLSLFSNVDGDRWLPRPSTILVDSEQLESGDAMTADFKKIAGREISEFKAELRVRYPDRDPEAITDEDLLREVLNTVGKPGKLGERIRCVVSVSMLTEGWDVNTVTHILGVRAFRTQLLCEQVMGRGLRRMSYVLNEQGLFDPEYAEVYGVPFEGWVPCARSTPAPKLGPKPARVRALDERRDCEITFPRLAGYRYELATERLTARFTDASRLELSTQDIATVTELAGVAGETSKHRLDELRRHREAEVAFGLARCILETYFRDDKGENLKTWCFPQLVPIARRWMAECLVCKDDTFPQLLLLAEFRDKAAGKIYAAVASGPEVEKTLKPILAPYDTIGSTRYVDFETTRARYRTRRDKCHVSDVVLDTKDWEQKMA